jgi:hypothetical protein
MLGRSLDRFHNERELKANFKDRFDYNHFTPLFF